MSKLVLVLTALLRVGPVESFARTRGHARSFSWPTPSSLSSVSSGSLASGGGGGGTATILQDGLPDDLSLQGSRAIGRDEMAGRLLSLTSEELVNGGLPTPFLAVALVRPLRYVTDVGEPVVKMPHRFRWASWAGRGGLGRCGPR